MATAAPPKPPSSVPGQIWKGYLDYFASTYPQLLPKLRNAEHAHNQIEFMAMVSAVLPPNKIGSTNFAELWQDVEALHHEGGHADTHTENHEEHDQDTHKKHGKKHDSSHGGSTSPRIMLEDPRYQELLRLKKMERFKSRKRKEHTKDDVDYLYGDLDNPEKPTIHTEVEQEFRRKYIEATKQYDEGKKKVYEHPEDDPVLQALKAKNKAHLSARETLLKQQGMGQDYQSELERMKTRIQQQSYRKFVDDHPEKAAAYATHEGNNLSDHVKYIKDIVLEKKENEPIVNKGDVKKDKQTIMAEETAAKKFEDAFQNAPVPQKPPILQPPPLPIVTPKQPPLIQTTQTPPTTPTEVADRLAALQKNASPPSSSSGLILPFGKKSAPAILPSPPQEYRQDHGPTPQEVQHIMSEMNEANTESPIIQGDFPRQRVPSTPSQTPSHSAPAPASAPSSPSPQRPSPKKQQNNSGNPATNALTNQLKNKAKDFAKDQAKKFLAKTVLLNPWFWAGVGILLLIILVIIIIFGGSPEKDSRETTIPGLTLLLSGPNQVMNPSEAGDSVIGHIQYTINASYTGDATITLSDQIPPNTTFVNASGTYTCSTNTPTCENGTISWELPTNQAITSTASDSGKTYNFTITLKPTAEDVLVKNVILASANGGTGGNQILPGEPNPNAFNQNIEYVIYTKSPPSNPVFEEFQKAAIPLGKSYGFPLSVITGMGANETGYGGSRFAKERNNWFGFTAYDDDPNKAKKYATISDSIIDFLNLITTKPRYAAAWKSFQETKDPVLLLQGIKAAGYASDPNYAPKVSSNPAFKFYDEQERKR